MTRYEERLEKDRSAIEQRVAEVGRDVERAFKTAVQTVLTGDRPLASATILADLPINRKVRDIDRLCHAFVARHLPSAGHLRFVSSVLRLDVALERIGDYAVTICREQVQLSAPPPTGVARDIDMIADQTRLMLNQSLRAFQECNAELARGTKVMASQVETTFQRVFSDLLEEGEKRSRPIKDLFALLVIFNRISRVSDQAKNICEEAIFTATGETKEPKVYRILFVDERNDAPSQMAQAYARRAFPESGRYDSAGWRPAEVLDPRLLVYLEKKGFDLRDARPRALADLYDDLSDYHVIVSLEGNARPHLRELPFHTVLLAWDIGHPAGDLDQQRTEALWDEAFERLRSELGALMETLRGERAS